MATELSLIDAFLSGFPRKLAPGTRLGPGDDCAVLKGSRLDSCVTTDAVVENVHFTRSGFSLEDIGWKALAVNLSDLAAMGCKPRWFVCAIGAAALTEDEARSLGRGMAALAKAEKISLVGGNFTSSDVLSLTLTVTGECAPGKALTRSGARVGDLLFVTGALGEARAGLAALAFGSAARAEGASRVVESGDITEQFVIAEHQSAPVGRGAAKGRGAGEGRDAPEGRAATNGPGAKGKRETTPTSRSAREIKPLEQLDSARQRRPLPRVALGLAAAPFATAAMDVSDGFARDLETLCAASGVRAEVQLASLPVSEIARRLAQSEDEALRWALSGGEDYELLLAVPPKKAAAFVRACRRARTAVTQVGRFSRGRGVSLVAEDGSKMSSPEGFDHFAV
jgi:thiamine monophosphate kinase